MTDLFGRQRIAKLETALDIAQNQIAQLREENRRLLCTINPHLKSAFFPNEMDAVRTPELVQSLCSVQMSEKNIRFCATHNQDLDAEGRCPVTEKTLFAKRVPQKRRILGSEWCH